VRHELCASEAGGGDPHGEQEIAPEEQRLALAVDSIVLQACGGDRLRLVRVGADGVMAESLEQVYQLPPRPGGFDRDGSSA
jgi:hypothetical protein